MAITTVAGIDSAWPGQEIHIIKTGFLYAGGGNIWSWWTQSGNPTLGSAPGAAAAPDVTTPGAIQFVNPASGNTYVARFQLAIGSSSPFFLYDRLSHMSGLSGIVTTAQTVNTAAWTRGDTTGLEVDAYLEIYTALGVTAQTATITYTNDAGTASRAGLAQIPASVPARRLLPVTLQAGDRGVRSVQTVTIPGSTGTAGNFGVTLVRPVAEVTNPVQNEISDEDWLALNLAQVDDSACLALISVSTGGITDVPLALLNLIQG